MMTTEDTDIPDLPTEEAIVSILRQRVVACQGHIEELQVERDRIRERDNDLRISQDEYRDKITEALKMIKVLVPPKTPDQMREEIETMVYTVLKDEAAKENSDGQLAVSRLITMIPAHFMAEYVGKGIENRIRQALKDMLDRDLLTMTTTRTQAGHQAQLWRIKATT